MTASTDSQMRLFRGLSRLGFEQIQIHEQNSLKHERMFHAL